MYSPFSLDERGVMRPLSILQRTLYLAPVLLEVAEAAEGAENRCGRRLVWEPIAGIRDGGIGRPGLRRGSERVIMVGHTVESDNGIPQDFPSLYYPPITQTPPA